MPSRFPFALLAGLLWLGVLAVEPARAHELPAADLHPLQAELNTILSLPCARQAGVGVKVVSLERGDVLGEYESSRPLVPASNEKLITAAAALHFLHPDFRFVTRFATEAAVGNGRVGGDLYLIGGGDPFLVSEEAWRLATALRNAGVTSVAGGLLADDSFFNGDFRGDGWPPNPGPRPYMAPISALSLNFNVVTVFVHPGREAGEPARVIVDPPTAYIAVENVARTAPRAVRSTIVVDRRVRSDSEVIVVQGEIPAGSGPERYFVGIENPPLYTATVVKEMLARMGVEVEGEVRLGQAPASARTVAEHESRSLAEIVQGMNKYSNNFVADQVFKTLGAEVYGPPGTWETGARAAADYLEGIGLAREAFTLADGSGLSRLNRISAEDLVRVLQRVYQDFYILPEFLASLSIMSVDGSLHRRLRGTEASREIRAKTGTLAGVSSLSGYARTQDGELVAFSIVINRLACTTLSARTLQNRIVLALVQFSRNH